MKTNNAYYNNVINNLKNKQGPDPDLIILSDYSSSDKQHVSVCLHRPNHIGKYHTHDFFEINYLSKGNCINLVEDDSILMNEGDMIIMHPGAFHNLYADNNSVVYNFLLDKKWLMNTLSSLNNGNGVLFDFFKHADSEAFYKYIMCPVADNKEFINNFAQNVIKNSKSKSPWNYILTETALLELLEAISSNCKTAYLSKGRGESSELMIDMLDYVSENCSTVNLDVLSEKYFYSKTHICRLFLKNTGKSFNTLLIDMKIGKACSLLETTNMTIDEIVDELGYDSVEYFYRLFKRKKGVTPKEYKKSNYL